MNKFKDIEKKQEELIAELEEEKLEQYIDHLAEKYFKTFIANNVKEHEAIVKLLKAVLDIHSFNYPNIVQYVYYSLLGYAFKLFNKAFSFEFNLKQLVISDLNKNQIPKDDIIKLEYERHLARSSEIQSFIWLEYCHRQGGGKNGYLYYLDHDDHRTLNKILDLIADNEEVVPEELLELAEELKYSINEVDVYEKTYHNFSVHQEEIIKELEADVKEREQHILRIKELEQEVKELKQQLEGA